MQFGEDRCTQLRVIVVTDPQTNLHTNTPTHKQTGPITIHCAAKLSAQCNKQSWNTAIKNSQDLKCMRSCLKLEERLLLTGCIRYMESGRQEIVKRVDSEERWSEECLKYRTVALVFHASKTLLRIFTERFRANTDKRSQNSHDLEEGEELPIR